LDRFECFNCLCSSIEHWNLLRMKSLENHLVVYVFPMHSMLNNHEAIHSYVLSFVCLFVLYDLPKIKEKCYWIKYNMKKNICSSVNLQRPKQTELVRLRVYLISEFQLTAACTRRSRIYYYTLENASGETGLVWNSKKWFFRIPEIYRGSLKDRRIKTQ